MLLLLDTKMLINYPNIFISAANHTMTNLAVDSSRWCNVYFSVKQINIVYYIFYNIVAYYNM